MADYKHIVRISIDKSRSHTVGIMPYIPYNEDETEPRFVSMGDDSGNWGGFPLDIAIAKEVTCRGIGNINVKKIRFKDGEEGCRVSSSKNRFRYAELARMYYEIQKMLRDGVFTQAITLCVNDPNEKTVCEQNERNCKYEENEKTPICDVVLTNRFNNIEMAKDDLFGNGKAMPNVYSFIPVPAEHFYEDGNGIYRLKYKMHDVSEVETATYFGENPNSTDVFLNKGSYYVIIKDYDKYLEYENAWKNWWSGNEIDSDLVFQVDGDNFRFCKAFEKYFIGKIEVPDDIVGVRVPPYVYYADIEEYKNWFERNNMTSKASLVGKPSDIRKEFDERGGLAFYNFLTKIGNSAPWITELPIVRNYYDISFVTPYISVPISLEDNHEYCGIYESYTQSYSEKDGFYSVASEFSGYGEDIQSWYEPTEGMYVDSNLSYVIDNGATEVENITGVFGTFDTSGGLSNIFKCVFRRGNRPGGERYVLDVRMNETEYGHWECERLSSAFADSILCGDGERIGSGENKYRTLTLLECIKDVVPTPTIGDVYYFLVRQDNCEEVPFRIPYSVNSFHNMTETNDPEIFTGDYVTSIETTENTWKIQYVIGGQARSTDSGVTFTKIDNTGIKYEEEYMYKPKQVMVTCIDGHDNVRIFYDWINIEEGKREVYSEEYGLYRKTNVAKIIGMEVGSIMTGANMSMISAMVFTREGSNSLPENTKNIFDVIIDRGLAAAFESHFKLSECNTFEDLKNYGNNFYNL